MAGFAVVSDEEFTTDSLNYVELLRPFDQHHLLMNFEYLLKEAVFKRHLQLKSTHPLFIIWHCVVVFDILPARQRELFFMVPKRWEFYKCSSLAYVPVPVVFACCHNFALTNDQKNSSFN